MKIFSQSPAIRDFDHQLRLRAMFESAAIGIGICHLNGRIADANPELSRLLGYSNDEFANSDILQLLDAPRLEVGHEIHQADPRNTREITAGHLSHDGGRVRADPAQLRQVLLNLVLNARDAMPQGGTITLSTRVAEFHSKLASELSRTTEAESPRRAVVLVVRDNGHGMNAETRMRLFEPFFTTKNPGDGTGLGLATVQRVVGELGATISIESEVGRGTCIEILIPSLMASIEKISNYGNFSNHRFSDPKGSIEQSSNQDDIALTQPLTPESLAKPAGNLVCDN